MIARLWETGIRPGMESAYDSFAYTYSRPMFAALPGCLGAFFLGTGATRSVLSLWIDQASIDALKDSELYKDTVARFLATGALLEPQTTKVLEVTGGTVNAATLTTELSDASAA